MIEFVQQYWPQAATTFVIVVAVVLCASVILYKRNEGAAIAWVGLILLSPIFGSIAYLLLGVNRIRRRAVRIRPHEHSVASLPASQGEAGACQAGSPQRPAPGSATAVHAGLVRMTDTLAPNRLTPANRITPLVNGDAAYPAMLSAIDDAKTAIGLETYIFNFDRVGRQFVAALKRAVERGVEVRVLVDGVGKIYSWPSITRALQEAAIPHALFMHSFWPWRMPYLNLRNHQKVLVVDGGVGFTGGMNISAANRVAGAKHRAVRDIHFRIEGPLVAHLADAFADDWHFTTRESLAGDGWFKPLTGAGDVTARGISSGPHESIDRIRWIMAAAVAEARHSLRIMTPYFLPDETLVAGLRLAAMRGTEVDIVLPEKTNLAFVTWASLARLDELIEAGCRVWLGAAPFNHAKFMLVDGSWALVGSSNWDPRSLTLNFEFNVECHGAAFVAELNEIFKAELAAARRLKLDDLRNRNVVLKLRDGVARLFSPYL